MLLCCCTRGDEFPQNDSRTESRIPAGCIPMQINFSADCGSRTSLQPSGASFWQQGDAIGVFSPQAYYESTFSFNRNLLSYNTPANNICLDAASGFNTPSATFGPSSIYDDEVVICTGNWGWNTLCDTMTFYAYSPYSRAAGANTRLSAVPFTLPALQTQNGNADTGHLGSVDFICARASISRPEGVENKQQVQSSIAFDFGHVFSLLKITVRNSTPDPLTVSGIVVESGDAPLAGDCTVDLSTGEVSAGCSIDGTGSTVKAGRSYTAGVQMQQGLEIARNGTATLSLMVFAGDHSASGLQITVNTSAGIQSFSSRTVLAAGTAYAKTVSLTSAGLQPAPSYDLQLIDFEDAGSGHCAADRYGSNFYDGSYTGYASGGVVFPANESKGSCMMYNGGFFPSRFNDMTSAGVSNQCSVFWRDAGTGAGGRRGSQTFCICTGYLDADATEYSRDTRAALHLADLHAEAVFDHVWVTNSTYAALSMMNGDAFAKRFSYSDKDYFKVTATGFRADGSQSGTAEIFLADFRTQTSGGIVTEWVRFDLWPLGAVNRIVFNMASSDTGEYGMSTPAYFCMDDLAIRTEKR